MNLRAKVPFFMNYTSGYTATVSGVNTISLPNAKANSLSSVKLFGGTQQEYKIVVPDGYTQLEYIQSPNANAYSLKLNRQATTSSKTELKINPQMISESAIMCQAWALNGYFLMFYENNIRWHCATAVDVPCSLNTDYTIKTENGKLTVNGTEYTCTPSTSIEIPSGTTYTGVKLFSGVTDAPQYPRGKFKLYYLKWYEGDTLEMNLVPAKRNSDSVVGLYDTIGNTFLSSEVSGVNFVAGPEAAPSPDTPIDIVSNNGVLKYSRNKVNVIADNVVVGKYISAQGVLSDSEYNFTYTPYVPVKPNTTYTLSFSSPVYFSSVSEYSSAEDAGFVVRQTKYSTSLDAPFDLTVFTFTTGATTNYIRFGSNMYKNQSLTIDDVLALNYMLAESATAIPYAPYVSDNGGVYTDGTTETIEDTIGNTATAEILLKVSDYQDTQEIIAGSVTRNVGVKVLDGTEGWQLATAANLVQFYTSSTQGVIANNVSIYSTIAPYGCTVATRTEYDFGCYSGGTGNLCFQMKGSAILTNTSAWTQFLADQYAAGTPVIVVYPLATATTESVAGQTLQVQAGNNTLEITQASLSGLELEAKYRRNK